jgi:hypothetical protein
MRRQCRIRAPIAPLIDSSNMVASTTDRVIVLFRSLFFRSSVPLSHSSMQSPPIETCVKIVDNEHGVSNFRQPSHHSSWTTRLCRAHTQLRRRYNWCAAAVLHTRCHVVGCRSSCFSRPRRASPSTNTARGANARPRSSKIAHIADWRRAACHALHASVASDRASLECISVDKHREESTRRPLSCSPQSSIPDAESSSEHCTSYRQVKDTLSAAPIECSQLSKSSELHRNSLASSSTVNRVRDCLHMPSVTSFYRTPQ